MKRWGAHSMFRGAAARVCSLALMAALALLLPLDEAAAQTCRCTPAQFTGACKSTVAHVAGKNSIQVTSDSQQCSLVEWTYKDGTKESELVRGGISHKIVLFDAAKPKPEIGATQCHICASSEPPMRSASAVFDKSNQIDAKPVVSSAPAAESSGNLAEDMKRALQNEFAAKNGGDSTQEDWDAVLSKVEQGNKLFAEQQRQLALQRQRDEEERRIRAEADRLEREAQLAEQQQYYEQETVDEGPNLLEMLNTINGVVQREAAASKRRLDATIANAQAQAAREQAQRAREEADRLRADSARRQAAFEAQQEAQRQLAMRNADAAEQGRLQTEQRRLDEQQRQRDMAQQREQEMARLQEQEAAAKQAEQRAKQEAERERQRAEAQKRAEEQRLAALRREEEANRRVEFKEGIVLCQQAGPKNWRCEGPLQLTYANLEDANNTRVNVSDACGGGTIRDLGTANGFRAFGCGYGIHPTDREYPGNIDLPAKYGLYVAGRGSFFCKRSVNAYCRER